MILILIVAAEMTLYTEPPTGNISYHKLERFALKRLDFLQKVRAARGDPRKLHQLVCEPSAVVDSDCLIAGSLKDKVSHFILRLLMGGDPESRQFFQEAETAWFDFQFSCMSEDEMKKFFYSVDKTIKKDVDSHRHGGPLSREGESIASVLRVFSIIRQSVSSWKHAVRLYMTQCSSRQFAVPFDSVLSLVRQRQVTLDRGMANVPWSKLREVVTEQFSSVMKLAAVQAGRHLPAAVADDYRLRVLWRKMKHISGSRHLGSPGAALMLGLSLEQVDAEAVHYPLCMSSLLQSLRHKHRLGHHARIQLSLFLKEVGLPVHHAVALWREEYSRPSGPGSSCSHSWQTDGRRYTYSIRHLYGLEGARRNYQGHCCDSLQQRVVGCNEEGGCPFSHWDDRSLSAQLAAKGVHSTDMIENILTLRRAGLFSAACYESLQVGRTGRAGQSEDACSESCAPESKRTPEVHSCQATISSSPDNRYRADSCVNQVCDVEDVVDADRVNSVEKTSPASAGESLFNLTITVAENRLSTTSNRTENACKRNHQNVSEDDVCKRRTTMHFPSGLKRCKITSDKSTSCGTHSEKCLQETGEECSIETESQGVQCFDHEVCPSQSQGQGDPFSSTKASGYQMIFRPVHYLHVSYHSLLQGLKS